MAIKKTAAATARPVSVVPAPAAASQTVIDIAPAEGASQALSLRAAASALVVVDKNSHRNGLEFIRGAKQLKRKIEDHWSAITRNVDDLKRNLLDLKRKDLEPVEGAIAVAQRVVLAYENDEAERVRLEEARIRREAEEKAARDRSAQLEAQEAEALRLEADSPDLSNREQIFVEAYVTGVGGALHNPFAAAQRAGYKDAARSAARLIETPKIIAAIAAKRQAQAIREQAEEQKAAPLEIVVEETVERQTAKVAGVSTRSTWSAEVVDFKALLRSLGITNENDLITAQLVLKPDTVFLNQRAGQLHENIAQVYPGVRGVEKKGIAG